MQMLPSTYLGQEYNSFPSKHPEQRRAVIMAAKTKLKLSVLWGKRKLIAPSFYSFLNSDLQETTVRKLLVDVVTEADATLSWDDAEAITLEVVEHIDEVSTSGKKRKKPSSDGRTNCTRLLDHSVLEVVEDVSTREFHFVINTRLLEETRPVVNAMQLLMGAQSRTNLVLPPPRNHADNTADDVLHNDILVWLEKEGVGWPRSEVETIGACFVNRITTGFFHLTPDMLNAMSDGHNAGINALRLPVPLR